MKQDFKDYNFLPVSYTWCSEVFILGAFQSWDFKLQMLSLHILVAYLHFHKVILEEPFHALYPQCLAHIWCTSCISESMNE